MIPLSRLYFITGITMVVLLASMIVDELIPVISSMWIDAITHPFIAGASILVIFVVLAERSQDQATIAFFISATIVLLTSVLNEGLIGMVATGTIPITIAILSSLSIRINQGWYLIGVIGTAGVLNATVLASSILLAIIIGAGLTLLIGRWQDA